MMRPLSETVSVCGQLTADGVRALAEQGVKTIINNRPEGEMYGQPTDAELAAVADELGVTWHFLPMSGGLSPDLLAGSEAAYAESPTPVVAFCGSGMRSAALWAFASVKEQGVESVMRAVSDAGYNLAQIEMPLRAYLEQNSES